MRNFMDAIVSAFVPEQTEKISALPRHHVVNPADNSGPQPCPLSVLSGSGFLASLWLWREIAGSPSKFSAN
jgi:hypothetical protein